MHSLPTVVLLVFWGVLGKPSNKMIGRFGTLKRGMGGNERETIHRAQDKSRDHPGYRGLTVVIVVGWNPL